MNDCGFSTLTCANAHLSNRMRRRKLPEFNQNKDIFLTIDIYASHKLLKDLLAINLTFSKCAHYSIYHQALFLRYGNNLPIDLKRRNSLSIFKNRLQNSNLKIIGKCVINRIAIHVKLIRYVLICFDNFVYMSENYFKL